MHKNLYTKTVDGIKAPAGAVNRALDAAEAREKKREPISMRRWTKVAIAASLALVILAGSAIGFDLFGGKNGNSFSLTVNALALSEDEFTVIESLDSVGGAIINVPDGTVVEEDFNFYCVCRGDNIASVTYTVENGEFSYNKKHVPDGREYLPLSDADANSYTVYYGEDYEALINGELDPGVRLYISLSDDDSEPDEAVRKAVSDYRDIVYLKLSDESGTTDYGPEIAECLDTMYRVMFDRVSVTVEITFSDGSTQTESIVFSSEGHDDSGRVDISAKLAA
ncbi:MAG: hypothetical protein J5569_00115 [Oscillospiraceae bacterium]|nr:hypothetical protein [Oscillospiraceae bacterium]